jgi:hypothetical protein
MTSTMTAVEIATDIRSTTESCFPQGHEALKTRVGHILDLLKPAMATEVLDAYRGSPQRQSGKQAKFTLMAICAERLKSWQRVQF